MKNILLTIAGFLMLIFATVGLVIPVLPTTPFILTSLACFSQNKKIKNKLLKIGFIKEYYNNYKERKGLKKFTVVISLLFLWITLLVSALLIHKLWLYCLLAAIGVLVTLHIVLMAIPKKLSKKSNNLVVAKSKNEKSDL